MPTILFTIHFLKYLKVVGFSVTFAFFLVEKNIICGSTIAVEEKYYYFKFENCGPLSTSPNVCCLQTTSRRDVWRTGPGRTSPTTRSAWTTPPCSPDPTTGRMSSSSCSDTRSPSSPCSSPSSSSCSSGESVFVVFA